MRGAESFLDNNGRLKAANEHVMPSKSQEAPLVLDA